MTRKNIRAVSRGHDETTVGSLRKDPKFAVEYLNAVLQDGDEQELMVAMRRIADAMGGVPNACKQDQAECYDPLPHAVEKKRQS
jgi:DNA-binding phage protein